MSESAFMAELTWKEHGIPVVTEGGAENITGFPYGPEHNIARK